MTIEIWAKGNIDQLPLLQELGLTNVELAVQNIEHLARMSEEDFLEKKGSIEIKNIHEDKGKIEINEKGSPNKVISCYSNVSDGYIIGRITQERLKCHIDFAKKHGILNFWPKI